MVIILLK